MTPISTSGTSSSNIGITGTPKANASYVFSDPVSITWSLSDRSTASSASGTNHSILSTRKQAGILVGVTMGVLLLFIITFGLFFLRPRQRKHPKTDLSKKEKHRGNEEYEPTTISNPIRASSWTSWRSMTVDTWFYETIAICFSLICFIAIFLILVVCDSGG
jgi:preprotein translocase subunit SecG